MPVVPGGLVRRLTPLLRPLPLIAALSWLAHPGGAPQSRVPEARARAVAGALEARALTVDVRDVHFVDDAPGALASRWERPRAIVRARADGGRHDVYLVRTRQSPEGAVLGVTDVFDLTRTSEADEQGLVARGSYAAYTIGSGGRVYRVELLDLSGERIPEAEHWSWESRMQQRLTSVQRTGQPAGVGRRSFKLDPAAHAVSLELGEGGLRITADGNTIDVPYDPAQPPAGGRHLREADRTPARPGNLVTWAVDRARDFSWFGDERMQLTKAVAYQAMDVVDRALATDGPAAADDVSDLGAVRAGAANDPATGFPPAPLSPVVSPPLDGEGRWIALDRDPFGQPAPGTVPLLVTTFLRGDRARQHSFVYVVGWDPRHVELDVAPGTEEPQSATGETGTGLVPRRPEVMSRLLGGFNGGFQSMHGDFGVMVEGEVLVPPKAFGATIARLRDGTTAFGTWPVDPRVPDDVVAFRQNLTPLVQDGTYNPYRRDVLGGVPQDWEDDTRTVRSALCLTKERFVFYFYATQIDPVKLGEMLIRARCDYGVHLDMNQGHTGFELYRVAPGAELPPLGRRLDAQWQAEGAVEGMPGWKFRGRRLVRNLQLMHFPRYVRRSARDFFYLTARHELPGAPLGGAPGDPAEGRWTTDGLPQHGRTPALAVTSVRPDPARPETKVRVLALDPGLVRRATADDADAPTVLAVGGNPGASGPAVWLGGRLAALGEAPASPDSFRLATGVVELPAATPAAMGVDPHGKVVYAEVSTGADPARDGALLARVLDDAGCRARVFLERTLPIAVGGTVDLSDHPVTLEPPATRLVRDDAPRGARLFPETPVVGPVEWLPIQRKARGTSDPRPAGAERASTASNDPR